MICELCPRNCGAERTEARAGGVCRQPALPVAAKAMLHQWEEPCLVGEHGAGTVFFSGCNLRCCFCQNGAISQGNVGKTITAERLRAIFRELIDRGAACLDLVTPTHFTPVILEALGEEPWPVPVVWNCGGYEKVETIRSLEGLVDIYLPDLKYADNRLAAALSGCGDYFQVAAAAIKEMVSQVGPVQWKGDKVTKGVIIRHLILPGFVDNSLKVLDWIGETFTPGEVLVSLMRQYTPMPGLPAPLDRPITEEEYDSVLSWMFLNDLEGFTQEDTASDTAYIPDF